MASAEKTFEVFLASPGDVDKERQAARLVVQDVDEKIARHHGWSIRVFGWEQRCPGLGRAQELINPRVTSCDLLVGILYQRWGTPTGDYSSGFEEEFECVRERHQNGEKVDAMVFVRELAEREEPEEGNEEFRERLKGTALFRGYKDTDDFKSVLFRELADVVNERIAEATTVETHGAVAALPPTQESPPELPIRAEGPAAQQARDALSRIAETAGGEEADEPSTLDVVRAQLAASAQASGLSESTLDLRDLNSAYQLRDEISLTGREQLLVARTMLVGGDYAPAWGLLGLDVGLRHIGVLAYNGRGPGVRAGAIRELGPRGFLAAIDDLAGEQAAARSWPLLGLAELDPSIRRQQPLRDRSSSETEAM